MVERGKKKGINLPYEKDKTDLEGEKICLIHRARESNSSFNINCGVRHRRVSASWRLSMWLKLSSWRRGSTPTRWTFPKSRDKSFSYRRRVFTHARTAIFEGNELNESSPEGLADINYLNYCTMGGAEGTSFMWWFLLEHVLRAKVYDSRKLHEFPLSKPSSWYKWINN